MKDFLASKLSITSRTTKPSYRRKSKRRCRRATLATTALSTGTTMLPIRVTTTLIDNLERVNPGATKYMRTIVGSRSNTSIITSHSPTAHHTTTTTTTEVDSRLIIEGTKPVSE